MVQKMKDEDLGQVAGGSYHVNGNTQSVAWDSIPGNYQLVNCSVYDAMQAMDGLAGTCGSQEEYDQACFNMLLSRGWLQL